MKINITMVTHNRAACTTRSILALHRSAGMDFDLVVVDNASTDETREVLGDLREKSFITHVAHFRRNMGAACAANYGWALADADFYVRMDNDIVVRRRNWLRDFTDMLRTYPEIAVLSFPVFGRKEDYETMRLSGDDALLHKPGSHPGGLFMIPRREFEAFGFWNEDYGAYGPEDGDYSLRVDLSGKIRAYFPDFAWGEHIGHGDQGMADYGRTKRRRQEQLTGPLGTFMVNELLYQVGLRSLRVERKYAAARENGHVVHAADPGYAARVLRLQKAARLFLKHEKVSTKTEALAGIAKYLEGL